MSRSIFRLAPQILGLLAATLLASGQTQAPPAGAAPPLAPPAHTAAPPPTGYKIGIIQIQSALAGTKDGQKAAAELQSRMGPKQKALEAQQQAIRDLQDKLNRSGSTMAENAKQDLMRTIDTKTKDYNRDLQDAQSDADEEQRKLLQDLGEKMRKVLDNYAATHGYSVILDVSNPNTPVIWATNAIDITREIIDLYDKMQPSAPSSSTAAKPPASKPTTPAVVKKP